MIVIINSCVPQLIGEDIDGVILELKDEIPELHVTYLNSGFNHPRSMPLGSDTAWAALIDGFEKQEGVSGSVGIVGRTGQDAGNLAPIDMILKRAGLETFVFPAPHIDEMSKIVKADTIYPIHITPNLTWSVGRVLIISRYRNRRQALPAGGPGRSRSFHRESRT